MGQESLERLHLHQVEGEIAGPLPKPRLADTLGKFPSSFVTSSSPIVLCHIQLPYPGNFKGLA